MALALLPQFADTADSSSGIGAFNINLKSFIFQLVTFVIVLLVFKRWILPPILKTLEERRKAVEKSLENAKETEAALSKAETQAHALLHKAREQADQLLADARAQSKESASQAAATADAQAKRIIDEAKERVGQEHAKLHDQLKGELTDLVAEATEKVLRKKINEQEDRRLIEESLKELG